MPQKNSDKKEQTPAVPLRRSPRFLQIVLVDPEDPRTPKPEPRRRTRVPSSATPLNSTGNVKVSSRCSSLRSNSNKKLQTLDEPSTQRSNNSKSRSRKPTRLTPCAEECTGEKISRSSKRRNNTNAKKTDNAGFTGNTVDICLLTEKDVNLSKQSKSKFSKNKVKNNKKSQDNNLAFNDSTTKEVLSITENPIPTPSIAHEEPTNKSDINNKIQNKVGEKRKRNQLQQGITATTHNWTKDQESALERAYLEAKPTPHFWKKVSRLVPGKSAQECFDKVHGSHLTPPPPRLRSRARIPNSKDSNLSASKLLSSSSPTTKKPKSRKQKSHVIQRTVRHMLQNQYKEQDSSEADLFSVLEPTFKLATPVRHLDMEVALNRCSTTGGYKKSLSRFSGGGSIVSPPVLKQVKNMALHEKYIDQLNCREAGRKVGSRRVGLGNSESEGVKGESSVKRKDAVKAAKNALVFGARDAISEFECKQGMALIDAFEDEFEDGDGGQVLF